MALNFHPPEEGEVFNTFHDMVHAAILSAGTGSATLKEIYSSCLQIGRVKCRKTGGWRFVTERRNWKSHIRHTLYTTEKFLRCPHDPDSWMLAPGFCHTLPQTTRQHNGCSTVDDQHRALPQAGRVIGPGPQAGPPYPGGTSAPQALPRDRRSVETAAAAAAGAPRHHHQLRASSRLAECSTRRAAAPPLEYDYEYDPVKDYDHHEHDQEKGEGQEGTDHEDEDEEAAVAAAVDEEDEGEENDAMSDQAWMRTRPADLQDLSKGGGAAAVLHASAGGRVGGSPGVLASYGVGSRSGRVQALLGITAAAAAADDAEDDLDLRDERTRTALLAAQEVLNNPTAARILLTLVRQRQHQLPDPIPWYLARHHGFQDRGHAAAGNPDQVAEDEETEGDMDDMVPPGRAADGLGCGTGTDPAPVGRHKQASTDGGGAAFWRQPQPGRAASAPAPDSDAAGAVAAATNGHRPRLRTGAPAAAAAAAAAPFARLNSAGVAARRTQLAATASKGPGGKVAAAGFWEQERQDPERLDPERQEEEEAGAEAQEQGGQQGGEQDADTRMDWDQPVQGPPLRRRGGGLARHDTDLPGLGGVGGRGQGAGLNAGFLALSRSFSQGLPQAHAGAAAGERELGAAWPRAPLGAQAAAVMSGLQGRAMAPPMRAASAPLQHLLAVPGARRPASPPQPPARQASSPLLTQAAAAAAMLQVAKAAVMTMTTTAGAASAAAACSAGAAEPVSRRGSGEIGALGKRRATDSATTTSSSLSEEGREDGEQEPRQQQHRLQLPQRRQEQPTKRLCPPMDLGRLAGGLQAYQRRTAAAAAAAAGSDNSNGLKLGSCLSAFTAY